MSTDASSVLVQLFFDGVMIGRYDKGIFEMGVLPAPNHTFTISIEEDSEKCGKKKLNIQFSRMELPPDDVRWELKVPENSSPAQVHLDGPTAPDRTKRPEGSDLMLDYRWVPDLANRFDFPNHGQDANGELPRHFGLLKPVLVFTTGLFYASILSRKILRRRQGNKGDWENFGFLPQHVVADIHLASGQEIALSVKKTGDEIFRLQAKAGRSYKVIFSNEPPFDSAQDSEAEITDPDKIDLNRPTHFQLSYLLCNVPPEKRYEVRYIPTPAKPEPEVLSFEDVRKALEEKPLTFGIPTSRCAPGGLSSKDSLAK